MKLGFIGTGKIASSVIEGINISKLNYRKITVSPRNRNIANRLKKKIKNLRIAKDNQDVIDNSDWVFLAVTPKVGKKIIGSLKFRTNQIIVSFISSIRPLAAFPLSDNFLPIRSIA